MTDYEGEETEVFVFCCVYGRLGADWGAVVAEHAELGGGFGFCECGAGVYEGEEDIFFQV